MEHCKKPVPKKGLVFSFLSATLLLSCLSGFGLLEFFLSATLLLAVAVGSLIAFCWLCRWLVYFHDVELAIGKKAGRRLIHPTLYGHRERGHVKFCVLQNRKPEARAEGCHVGFPSISSRTCCQCRRSSRSLPIAAMYSHASPIVRSVPPSLVGIGEVSFLERYAELNMAER